MRRLAPECVPRVRHPPRCRRSSARTSHDRKHFRPSPLLRSAAASWRHRRYEVADAAGRAHRDHLRLGRLPDSAAATGHLHRVVRPCGISDQSTDAAGRVHAQRAGRRDDVGGRLSTKTVTVVADAQPLGQTAQVATNFKQELMATLPSNRTIDAVLLMAPSVHATGPRGAFSIDGALSYENLYTAERRASSTRTCEALGTRSTSRTPCRKSPWRRPACRPSTAGSREGMVTAITKSGGNVFSGSFRTSFANDYWRSQTPAASDPKRDRNAANPGTIPTYEATFGGPVCKERLWFFGATRIKNEETARTHGRHAHSVHPHERRKALRRAS